MTRIFNVSYEFVYTPTNEATKRNVILIDRHPLIWAVNAPDNNENLFLTVITNWNEVNPEDVEAVLEDLMKSSSLLDIQDYRED